MDKLPGRDEEFVMDLEIGGVMSDSEITNACSGFSFDKSGKDEIKVHLKKLDDDEEKKKKNKEKRKTRRPPRYPKSALSLDASDQRLIKEISRIAMIKHARDEKMKAVKKIKAAKASSSSIGNLFAMITTFLFCLILIFQGMSSSKRLTPISIQSPHPSSAIKNHMVPVNDPSNMSTWTNNVTLTGSLKTLEPQDDDKGT